MTKRMREVLSKLNGATTQAEILAVEQSFDPAPFTAEERQSLSRAFGDRWQHLRDAGSKIDPRTSRRLTTAAWKQRPRRK